jgi:hypothetical protein
VLPRASAGTADLLVNQEEHILPLLFQQGFIELPPAAASALPRQQEFSEFSHGNHLLSIRHARIPGATKSGSFIKGRLGGFSSQAQSIDGSFNKGSRISAITCRTALKPQLDSEESERIAGRSVAPGKPVKWLHPAPAPAAGKQERYRHCRLGPPGDPGKTLWGRE